MAAISVLSLAADSLSLLGSATGQRGAPNQPGPDSGLRLKERAHIEVRRPTVLEERNALECARIAGWLKMHRDRFYLYRILSATLRHIISDSGQYGPLTEAVNEAHDRVQEEQRVLREDVESEAELKALHAQLEQEKATSRFRLGRAHVEICNLEHKAHDSGIVCDIKCRLVNRWELSRREQLQLCRRMEEDECRDVARLFRAETVRETRVHAEKKIFFERIIAEYERKACEWAESYAADAVMRDSGLREARSRLRELRTAAERLRGTLHERDREMAEYVEQRDAKRREQEMLREMNDAATRIQAWWRGTMFRRIIKKAKSKAKDRKTPEGKKIKS